jgi:hypothetical protein
MVKFSSSAAASRRRAMLLLAFVASGSAWAQGSAPQVQSSASALAVRAALPLPPADVTDLKFREFYKLPVGPKGLDPTERLLGLDGKKVRLVGYMVQEEHPQAGAFILSPIPTALGDEDESLADDLPPAVVFVHTGLPAPVPHRGGLISVSGRLAVGAADEPGGRVSLVRLAPDEQTLRQLQPDVAAN